MSREGSGTGRKSTPGIILEAFRAKPGIIVSGAELSHLLGVSRSAVWKQISGLRALGYRFEAVPSQGYRLLSSPDILTSEEITAGLNVTRLGKSIVCLPDTGSTNTVAFRMAEDGAAEGTVVIADTQRQGKGRLGRQWESPATVNLYCSLVLRPPIMPMAAFQLTFLSAVAVARAIEQITALVPQIKWPNDILINGNKVAGLLNEMSAETEKVNFVILGIGVNLNMRREQFPADLRHPASSLFLESGKAVGRTDFVRCLLMALDDLYSTYLGRGYDPIREEWLARCNVIGRMVRVETGGVPMTGTVSGVDENGALLLQLSDGREERVLAGDVALL